MLPKESSLRIVSCNTAVSLKSKVAKIYLSSQVNFALPSISILLIKKKKKILHFRSPQNISMVAMLLSLFPNIKNSDLWYIYIYIYQFTEVKHVRIAEFFFIRVSWKINPFCTLH